MSVATMSRLTKRAYLRLRPEKTTKNRIEEGKCFKDEVADESYFTYSDNERM